jgi:hypothetical protein
MGSYARRHKILFFLGNCPNNSQLIPYSIIGMQFKDKCVPIQCEINKDVLERTYEYGNICGLLELKKIDRFLTAS